MFSFRTTNAMRDGGAGVAGGGWHLSGCGLRQLPPVGTAAPPERRLQPVSSSEGDWLGNRQV